METTRSRANRVLEKSRFVLASIALLTPCFWQSRIQAGDLASHSYNAWLAERIASGGAPGLRIVGQTTNVLFDLILGVLSRGVGSGAAERVSVALAVLTFAWGAFAFVSTVSGRRAWNLFPCIAMLAYGWVFHIGFFNFYLGLGLSLWALALSWSFAPVRVAAALPILALAWLAHALPVVWAIALFAFAFLWQRLPARLRPFAACAAIALLVFASALISQRFPSRWSLGQAALMTGADQLRVFDRKYDLLALALFAVWSVAITRSIRTDGPRRVFSGLDLQLFLLCAAAVFVVPGKIQLPGYGHALVFIAERMSLTAAVLACAVVARLGRGSSGLLFTGIAVVFFAFLYRDERILNQFEDQLVAIVERIPAGQRVVLGVRDPTLRVNALAHTIDRACIGRCFSYANYEASTSQFRIRADAPNPIVISDYAGSSALQNGGYRVRERDLPLFEIAFAPDGGFEARRLAAGTRTRVAQVEILR